ncbi:hypothetical protein, partial [Candidatus Rhabdochlamydia sp. W815]|uniref:hypothetical protein n=1 Tax=Candidatus Rhabdochlamydia sp. W815 TaxID=2720721 RepID=UPI001BFCAF5A
DLKKSRLYWRVYPTPFKEQPLLCVQLWHVYKKILNKHAMLGCAIDGFSSIYMFFFVHFEVERAANKSVLKVLFLINR